MAITRYAGDRFYGLDSEKNTLILQVMDGAHYTASDTRTTYTKINGFPNNFFGWAGGRCCIQ